MISVFRRGDYPSCAYFADPGSLFIAVDSKRLQEVAFAGGVIGTLEHFLDDLSPRFKGRLIDLAVDDTVKIRPVPFETVDQMIYDYEFGFNTNVFLSNLLEATNNFYVTEAETFSEELRAYQIRAIHFADLVRDLAEYAREAGGRDLKKLVHRWRKEEIYIDGEILSRNHRVRAISVLPNPLTKWIESYKRNSAICRDGAAAHAMYILLEGKIAVAKEDRYLTEISQSGEAFGELALFLDGKRTATLVAETDSKLYVLKREDMPAFHRRHNDVFLNIAHTLAKRIHDNIERIVRLKTRMVQAGVGSGENQRNYALEESSWRAIRSLHLAVSNYYWQNPDQRLQKIMSVHSVL